MIPPLRRSAVSALRAFVSEHSPDARFVEQLASRFFDIYRLFERLYGARVDRKDLFNELITLLYAAWRSRPESLRELDDRRARDGAWYADGSRVGMQLYVERFCGDLATLRHELGYFEDLGVNLLHIMPVLRTPDGQNDGGYAVSDYLSVRPDLGSLEDVRQLAADMHRRDMVLVFDFVANHTSDEHAWARRAIGGDTTFQDYYFMFPDRSIPDLFDRSMPEVFPEMAPGNFTYRSEIDRWVMTVFHRYQWDLNYSNPRVFLSMISVMLELANLGIDIFRLDAVPYLWKRLGTSGQNLPEAHVLVRLFHACIQAVAPGVATIAEAIVQPGEIVRYFGEGEWAGRECELTYNAGLMVLVWDALATGKPALLQRGLAELPSPPADTTWLNYVRCHDDIGLGYDEAHIRAEGWDPQSHREFMVRFYTGEFPGSPARGARFMPNPRTGDARISGTTASLAGLESAEHDSSAQDVAIARIILLHAIILSITGIPIIYAGDELGLTNDRSFLDSPLLAADNRWMHRPWVSREQRESRLVSGTPAHRIFAALRSLISTRDRSPALRSSAPVRIIGSEDPHLLAYTRTAGGNRVLVVCNVGAEQRRVPVGLLRTAGFEEGGIDIAHGRSWHARVPEGSLDGYGFFWLTATG